MNTTIIPIITPKKQVQAVRPRPRRPRPAVPVVNSLPEAPIPVLERTVDQLFDLLLAGARLNEQEAYAGAL